MSIRARGGPKWKLHPVSHFENMAPAWNALNEEAGNVPFLHSDFLSVALAEFGSGKELLGICGSDVAPIAMGLFVRKRVGTWETFQPSQLPLGAFVARSGPDLQRLLRRLLPEFPGCALAVAVTQQDPAIRDRPCGSAFLDTLDYIDTARVAVEGSFDAFWSARGKNLRQNVKKQIAKLRQDGVVPRLETITDSRFVAGAIEHYGRLESAGWKAQSGTAVGARDSQGRFYRRVFESFCDAGTGRIYVYLFGDKIVAMDLCLMAGPVLVVLKTAYDESLKQISPASLLRHDYFWQIFEEGRIRKVEFYGKAMDWHLRWTNDVRTLYHVNCYRWPWVKRLHVSATRRREKLLPAAGVDNVGSREDGV